MRSRFHRARPRLTFANVVSMLALFVALSGTALGAALITSNSQVAPNTIQGAAATSGNKNIVAGTLGQTDLASRAVTGGKVAADTLTGINVKESALAKVPSATSADLLGGVSQSQLIHGTGRVREIKAVVPAGGFKTLMTFTDLVDLQAVCGATDSSPGSFQFATKSRFVTLYSDGGAPDPALHDIAPNTLIASSDWQVSPARDAFTFSASSGVRTATISVFSRHTTTVVDGSACFFQGHAVETP